MLKYHRNNERNQKPTLKAILAYYNPGSWIEPKRQSPPLYLDFKKGAALTQWLGAVHKQSPEVNAAGFLILHKREHSKKKKKKKS